MTTVSKHRSGMGVERDKAIESYIADSVTWYLTTSRRLHGRVLDVGCNYGYAMKLMAMCGWDVRGIDIDPQHLLPEVSNFIHKWPMEQLSAYVIGRNFSPDLFFFNHTLEHSKRPWDVLEAASVLLKRGGDVFIAYPSPNNEEYVAEGHYTIFNEKFMRFMLKESGFEVVAERTITLRPGHEECRVIGRVK